MLKETASCIWSWTTKDRLHFRSFAVAAQGEVVLIDPVPLDADEAHAIHALGTVNAILLTTDWHERDSDAIGRQFGVPVYAHADAVPNCVNKAVKPFPDELPLGIEAVSATGTTPGQVAFLVPFGSGSLVAGDFWQNLDLHGSPWLMRQIMRHVIKLRHGLQLMPPSKCQDPQAVVACGHRLLDLPFENLLVSHGRLLIGDAKPRMAERLKQGP